MLCLFQDLRHALLAVIAIVFNLLIDLDDLTEQSFVLDDLGIGCHIDRHRHSCDQITDIFQTCHFRRHILFPQLILQGDQIHRLSAIIKFYNGFKQDAILLMIEIILCQNFRCRQDRITIHNHGANN